jgi:hypothetical protein
LTHKIAVATIAGNLEFSPLVIKDARRNYKPWWPKRATSKA